jgi:RNA polymerase sigma-70 factor (ECF subfamily)
MQPVDVVDVDAACPPSTLYQGQALAFSSEGTPVPSSREHASAVVSLHFDFIWRLLRRLGVFEHEVDDAAQQVFLTATRKGLRGDAAAARPFLYSVALRVAANFRRTARRRREVSEDAAIEPHATGPAADDVADLRRARAILDRILDDMPLELRVVFILSEIEQLTAAGIAELEGIPPGTVASRLRRARELFRRHLAALDTCDPIGGHR